LDKQYRFTTQSFRTEGDDPTIPDNYIDPVALAQAKKLAGIDTLGSTEPLTTPLPNIGTDKGTYQSQHNVKPGTDEWFKLWFAKPNITGENPKPKN
jgi:hypothetical protein